jgi:hypothetical protein
VALPLLRARRGRARIRALEARVRPVAAPRARPRPRPATRRPDDARPPLTSPRASTSRTTRRVGEVRSPRHCRREHRLVYPAARARARHGRNRPRRPSSRRRTAPPTRLRSTQPLARRFCQSKRQALLVVEPLGESRAVGLFDHDRLRDLVPGHGQDSAVGGTAAPRRPRVSARDERSSACHCTRRETARGTASRGGIPSRLFGRSHCGRRPPCACL